MAQNKNVQRVRTLFQGLPVDVYENGNVICVKLSRRVTDSEFRRYVDVAKRLRMRFNEADRAWCADASALSGVAYYRNFCYVDKSLVDGQTLEPLLCYEIETWRRDGQTPKKEVVSVCHFKDEGDRWRIPRGLARRVAEVAGIELPDFAPVLKEPDDFQGLREYQVEVFKSVAAALRKTGAATIQMATGAGKSFLAGALAKWLNENGYVVFLVAMQKDLVLQLKEHAERAGAKNVVAVTVQTLYRRLQDSNGDGEENGLDEEDREVLEYMDDYSDVDEESLIRLFKQHNVAVIMDEVHHVPARTARTIMMEAGDGWALKIGLSATPWRNDSRDMDIYAYCGEVVEPRISSSYLIERGYAVPVEIRVLEAPVCEAAAELSKAMARNRDLRGSSGFASLRKAVVECDRRNEFIARLAAEAEKPALVITQLVKHAEMLGRMMRGAGLKAAVVTGVVKAEERKKIYEALKRGEVDVIVATTLADEGLDLPPLRTLIIAVGGRSRTRALQRIGRLVRPYPGKTKAIAIELFDDYIYFRDHLRQRLRLYATEPHWKIISDVKI